jgi:hypothetical protein
VVDHANPAHLLCLQLPRPHIVQQLFRLLYLCGTKALVLAHPTGPASSHSPHLPAACSIV